MTPRALSLEEVEQLEDRLAKLNYVLHETLLATNVLSVDEWNEKIAPRMKDVTSLILGTEVHARSYRAHESIYPPKRFVPTHKHAEGGEYRKVGDVSIHLEENTWVPGTLYESADGRKYVRTSFNFYHRFIPLTPP